MIIRNWNIPCKLKGTIIDLETTSLEPKDGELVTAGFFFDEKILIYQKEENDSCFPNDVEEFLKKCPRPFLSYNKSFEEKWLKIKFDHDLMNMWKKRAQKRFDIRTNQVMKWPKVTELISTPFEYYGELDIDGSEVPTCWKKYLDDKQKIHLEKIIEHNNFDLRREACLWLWENSRQTY